MSNTQYPVPEWYNPANTDNVAVKPPYQQWEPDVPNDLAGLAIAVEAQKMDKAYISEISDMINQVYEQALTAINSKIGALAIPAIKALLPDGGQPPTSVAIVDYSVPGSIQPYTCVPTAADLPVGAIEGDLALTLATDTTISPYVMDGGQWIELTDTLLTVEDFWSFIDHSSSVRMWLRSQWTSGGNIDISGLATIEQLNSAVSGLASIVGTKLDKSTSASITYGTDANGKQIVMNNAYNTTEMSTGRVWIDGNPIYRRVWTGAITAAADTRVSTFLSGSAIKHIVDFGGYWTNINNTELAIGGNEDLAGNPGSNYESSGLEIYGGDRTVRLFTSSQFARSEKPYVIWIEYTTE
jgi:hypothetical protein